MILNTSPCNRWGVFYLRNYNRNIGKWCGDGEIVLENLFWRGIIWRNLVYSLSLQFKRENLVEILLEAAKSMVQLEDCEIYLVNIVEKELNAVYAYEVWSNEKAHQNSLVLETTQTLINRAKAIITGAEKMGTFITKGGKGIS